VTIDGIRADPSQVKPFSPPPPKEKKKRVAQPVEGQEEKNNWITVGVVHKKTNDLLKYIQTLEKKIDHEMLECLEFRDKLEALRHYVFNKK
jgi:flagellar biosynthesis chaperone FliJ